MLILQETEKLGGPLQEMEGLRMAVMDVSNRSFNSDGEGVCCMGRAKGKLGLVASARFSTETSFNAYGEKGCVRREL